MKELECVVRELEPFTLCGVLRRFREEDCFEKVPLFWDEYAAKGFDKIIPGKFGLNINDGADSKTFAYMICDEITPDLLPEGFTVYNVPALTWAMFHATGPMPGALQQLNREIFTKWLPENGVYDVNCMYMLEAYGTGDMSAADYDSWIWVPVVKKSTT